MSRVQFEKSIFFFQSTDLSFALLVAFDLFLLLDDKPWSHRPIHRPYLVRAPVARLANRFVRVVDTPQADSQTLTRSLHDELVIVNQMYNVFLYVGIKKGTC